VKAILFNPGAMLRWLFYALAAFFSQSLCWLQGADEPEKCNLPKLSGPLFMPKNQSVHTKKPLA